MSPSRWTSCVALLLVTCDPDPAVDTSVGTDTSNGADTGDGNCIAGQSIACACGGGGMGAQVCLANESGFGPCDCGMSPGGTSSNPMGDGSGNLTGLSTESGTTQGVGETITSGTSGGDATNGGGSTSGVSTGGSTSGTSGGSTSGGDGLLEGWTRRRLLTVENLLPVDLVDFQVPFNVVHDADMQTNFQDIRLTEADGESLLPYWIQRFTPLNDADVWVRVPLVPASGTVDLWLYYGNGAVSDGSDGEATMFFFDDFEGNSLDALKWTATSDHVVAADRLEVQTGAVYSNDAVVEPGQLLQGRIQWDCCEGANDSGEFLAALAQSDTGLSDFQTIRLPMAIQFNASGASLNTNVYLGQQGFQGTWHTVGLAREFAQVHFWRNPPAPAFLLSYAHIMPGPYYIILGHRDGATAPSSPLNDFWVDYVFVRTFALFDPTGTVGDEEVVP